MLPKPSFKLLSTVTAIIAVLLSAVLILFPALLYWLFAIAEHASADFIGRRTAMLFLGIAFICWFARNAEHSQARQAICLGLSISMFSLAALGLFELMRGIAGLGIVLAIMTEAILALAYFQVWFKHKALRPVQ